MGLDPAGIPPCDPIPSSDPAIVFAYTKLLWAVGAHEEAVSRLCVLKTHVLEPLLRAETGINSAQQSSSVFQLLSPNVLNTNETLDSLDSRQLEIQIVNERKELRRLLAKYALFFLCLILATFYRLLFFSLITI